jgi:hypothetical protein
MTSHPERKGAFSDAHGQAVGPKIGGPRYSGGLVL